MDREYWTLTAWVEGWSHFIIDPISRLLSRLGIQPNLLSVIGFFAASAAGALIAAGYFFHGGWLFFLSGPFDALDGAVARTAGLESRFGAFLDSFLDRYSEAAVLFGILYWAIMHDSPVLVLLTFLTLVGSFMVSYARARAEGLNISCKVGLFTRLERFIVLAITLLTQQLLIGLIILAFLSNFTALQRLFHVYRQSLDSG
ncbi:MAG: CDP-alcohol phosphatidyltransferase family protein [Deltaproteobacteria bacterium]|nr:CDP-alcohol phosphatidyltransferase family protein [Deltaproteobacteria bacterium]